MYSSAIDSLPRNNRHNNLNRINLILLQHIIENNNINIQLIPQLFLKHFLHNDIQTIIDIDHKNLLNSSNIDIGSKIVEIIFKTT